MKRGCRGSSPSAVRTSLIAVFRTDSLTNRWPHTSSSNAFLVSNDPGCRASAHSRAKGVGARGTGFPPRSRVAFASSRSNVSKCTRRRHRKKIIISPWSWLTQVSEAVCMPCIADLRSSIGGRYGADCLCGKCLTFQMPLAANPGNQNPRPVAVVHRAIDLSMRYKYATVSANGALTTIPCQRSSCTASIHPCLSRTTWPDSC